MHDIIVDTNPIMFFLQILQPFFCCRFVFSSLTVLCALKHFLPQWRQSKRSWWRRCWLPGWTRPPPTNIFNSFAVQESPEKEVSQSWPFLSFLSPHSPQNAINYIPALSNIPVPLSQRPSCLRTRAKEKAINLDLIFVFWSTCFFSQHHTSTLSNRFSFPLPHPA